MAGSPAAGTEGPGTALRSWLAQIWRLAERRRHAESDWVGTGDLGESMNASPPVVNRMITRLRRDDLLRHEPYHGVRLTDEGRRVALLELRRQRIAEVFLERVMGFGWHEVHSEATRMCSGLDDLLVERMAEMSGRPRRCPHGELIPAQDGDLTPMDDCPLSGVEAKGGALRVTRVLTREPDRLEYLAALGLRPDTELEVIHTAPFEGPLQLRIGREYRIIGHSLAELICVAPLP
ncbi:MAG: metal-dependent transcriptional regulator [Anaerolineaceae bacterium]|nr:metal-dependent transcriptional regulator [Anaerolineaceae bacterium]